ncbi:MAG: Clp1/GlmU family protein [Candidatus Bathyarchaeia archaeon]
MRYLLPVNRTLIVRGPATLNLIDGHASILGAPLEKSARIVIQREKQLPVESIRKVEVEIALGANGAIIEIEGSSLPESWKNVANSLEAMGKGTAMIIGPSDAGKSALCTYLMNELIKRKCNVRVLDADIGQADIGPPTTIASSTATLPKPTLSYLEPDRMFFVGHNTPSFVQSQVLHGINRILSSESTGLTVINTDGWIRDSSAILYKKRLISAVKPDILVGIGSRSSLNPILQTTKTHKIIVESSRVILSRTRSERKQIRKSGYQRFLSNSTLQTFKLDNTKLRLRESVRQAFFEGNLDLTNVLLGFLNNKGFMKQIGILERMTPNYLTVYSRPIHQPVTIEFGYVKLSRDGSELGFLV